MLPVMSTWVRLFAPAVVVAIGLVAYLAYTDRLGVSGRIGVLIFLALAAGISSAGVALERRMDKRR